MGLGDVPMTALGGFVEVRAQMYAKGDAIELLRKIEIGRRRVCRVTADDHKCVNATRSHIRVQLTQRVGTALRIGVNRFRIEDRLANVTQPTVDQMRESVNLGWLNLASHDDRAATMRLDVFN